MQISLSRFWSSKLSRLALSLSTAALVVIGSQGTSQAASKDIVGVLAIAVEKDVADQIGLDDEARNKLLDFVSAREADALELMKSAAPEEKAAKMAAFIAETEKQGLALLTADQRAKLEQVRLGFVGVSAIGDVAVGAKLGLSPDQKDQIAALLKERAEEVAKADESKRSTTEQYYDKKLVKILTPEQKAKWDLLAGVQPPAEAPVAAEGDAPSSPMGTPAAGAPGTGAPGTPGAPATGTPSERGPGGFGERGPGGFGERGSGRSSEGGFRGGRGSGESGRGFGPPGGGVGGAGAEAPKVEPIVRSTIKPSPDGKIRFSFRYAPWKDVLDWVAGTADLSLEMSSAPPGTFNYTDNRAYSPAEAIDLLNGILLTKGYTLVLRERMLLVVNLEEGGDVLRNLAPQVKPEDLDKYGDHQLVACLFQLQKYTPEDAEADIRKFIGPQGSMLVMPKAKQIYVSEMAGKLRTINRIIQGVENPDAGMADQLVEVVLKHAGTDEVMVILRQLLGMSEDRNATPDGSLRIAIDALAGRLLLSGKPEKIAMAKKVIEIADVPAGPEGSSLAGPIESPQLEIYKIAGANSASVLRVLQTLLADLPDVRMELDSATGNLIALARPSQHATIKATLQQMQSEPLQVEVITLNRLDVQLVVLSLTKMFGGGEGGDARAPKFDGDPSTRQLIVRGSSDQIAQVKSILEKMGETTSSSLASASTERKHVRPIDLPANSNATALQALEQIEAIWGATGRNGNRIRVVTPSSAPDTVRPREMSVHPTTPVESGTDRHVPLLPQTNQFNSPAPRTTPALPKPTVPTDTKSTQSKLRGIPLHYATYQQPSEDVAAQPLVPVDQAAPKAETPKAEATQPEATPEKKEVTKPGAEIIVTMGPNGIIIASEDLDALDEFETLLRAAIDRLPAGGGAQDFTVFYLKFAKAEVAAALLAETIGASAGSTTTESSGGGGGGLMGSMMNAALGDAGGGLLGGLFGLDGGGSSGASAIPAAVATTGKVSVIPDIRQNALIVHASPSDTELVKTLLSVIDQSHGPVQVETQPLPRMIPIKYAAAEDVARQVREIFATRLQAQQGQGGQQRQISPEEFLRAIGGGRGGRGGGGAGGQQQRQRGEEQKMTISVDARSNSLVVSAPEPLFREVEAMVEQLDQAGAEASEVTQVFTLKNSNPEVIQRGLQSLLGPNVTTNITQMGNGTPQAQSGAFQSNNRGGTNRGGQSGQSNRGGQQFNRGGQGGNFQQQFQQFNRGGQGGFGAGGQGGRGGQGNRGGGR